MNFKVYKRSRYTRLDNAVQWNPHSLLMGMQKGVNLEDSLTVFYKMKYAFII